MQSPDETGDDKRPAFPVDAAGIRDSDWTVVGQDGATVIVVDSLDKTFGLEELLYEQRDTAVTLKLEPDAYLLSYIMTFSTRPECILPDRADMTYSTHCLRSYMRHVLDVAGRRNVQVQGAPEQDVDPFLAGDERVVAEDLLQVPRGRITENGVRDNIRIVLQGTIDLLAARDTVQSLSTIELCRAQLWQWVHHETGVLDTGRIISTALFDAWLEEERAALAGKASASPVDARHLEQAASLLANLTHAETLAPSLADEAYRLAE